MKKLTEDQKHFYFGFWCLLCIIGAVALILNCAFNPDIGAGKLVVISGVISFTAFLLIAGAWKGFWPGKNKER